ncbi:hypothetical protein ON010_g7418 [Phytophthora cinnamomi]|nr:hypothetical protein ON010_g7418 [Phytophthora cinnamomi]
MQRGEWPQGAGWRRDATASAHSETESRRAKIERGLGVGTCLVWSSARRLAVRSPVTCWSALAHPPSGQRASEHSFTERTRGDTVLSFLSRPNSAPLTALSRYTGLRGPRKQEKGLVPVPKSPKKRMRQRTRSVVNVREYFRVDGSDDEDAEDWMALALQGAPPRKDLAGLVVKPKKARARTSTCDSLAETDDDTDDEEDDGILRIRACSRSTRSSGARGASTTSATPATRRRSTSTRSATRCCRYSKSPIIFWPVAPPKVPTNGFRPLWQPIRK